MGALGLEGPALRGDDRREPRRGLDCAERVITLSRQAGDEFMCEWGCGDRALALGYAGLVEEAATELDRARNRLRPETSPNLRSFYDYVAGEIRLERTPREALTFLVRARDSARLAGNRFFVGVARLSALSCAARLGEPVDLADFAELLDHWQRLGSWPQLWITVRILVEMLTRLGRDQEAATLLGALSTSEKAPPIVGADAGRMAEAVATLQRRLGDDRFRRLHAAGATLDDDNAIASALDATGGSARAPIGPPANGLTITRSANTKRV